ncbi:class I SAM-dependent methyltransferase [Streptomyces kunmingensis]|uniref:Class I SAM-dependent methyltransferase n=1 Tax=Streptomyces kunmingensis TaxID=68225 RepID=A0ABU6C857_9ACTN|nr:class I SAM-dependent methyltransferase [Streptomyces kunmingensis]MEB3960903.1 class I SAM-dependent methyltransferase [Streptomyces kunmingensis]
MTQQPGFYSKVAEKFGGYSSGAQRTTSYPQGDPEEEFDALVHELGTPTGRLLDVGCADGRNLLSVAPSFGRVEALDLSPEMLASAEHHRAESGLDHVRFAVGDASATGFPDGAFDLVTSRRGPLFPDEFRRVLRTGGSVVYLGIGERDVRTLKEAFGRGQLYGRWTGTPVALEERRRLEDAGFTVDYEREFSYDEFFHTPGDLDRFLQMVPIFEDYDSESDREAFDRYVGQATTQEGIHLARHWFVLRARLTAEG